MARHARSLLLGGKYEKKLQLTQTMNEPMSDEFVIFVYRALRLTTTRRSSTTYATTCRRGYNYTRLTAHNCGAARSDAHISDALLSACSQTHRKPTTRRCASTRGLRWGCWRRILKAPRSRPHLFSPANTVGLELPPGSLMKNFPHSASGEKLRPVELLILSRPVTAIRSGAAGPAECQGIDVPGGKADNTTPF